jgi:hypothetical protein
MEIDAALADRIRDRLGNPLFAIETNLEPLKRRINEHKPAEILEVASAIESSTDTLLERSQELMAEFADDTPLYARLCALRASFFVLGLLATAAKNRREANECESALATVANLQRLLDLAKNNLP